MQLIKPERKCVNIKNRYHEPDLNISFYYSNYNKTQILKRTFRISMRNFFYRLKYKWKYVAFGIEDNHIVIFEGNESNGYSFSKDEYICNVSLIETICDVYKIEIKDKPFQLNFKCDSINGKMYRLIEV